MEAKVDTGQGVVTHRLCGGKIDNHNVDGVCVCIFVVEAFMNSYHTYNVDQSYRQGNIFHIALWLGQYLDIALPSGHSQTLHL